MGASRVLRLPQDRVLIGYDDGAVEVRDMAYFFRHAAGQAEYQRTVLERARGAAYDRAADVIEWSRQVLAAVRR